MDADTYHAHLDSIVEARGVAIQYVFGDDREPPFAYTVGLSQVPSPEFIVFGVPEALAAAILNDVADATMAADLTFAAGDRVHQLLRNGPVLLGSVADPSDRLLAAGAFAARRGSDPTSVTALQVHLPDPAGRLPGVRGYDAGGAPSLGAVPVTGNSVTIPRPPPHPTRAWLN